MLLVCWLTDFSRQNTFILAFVVCLTAWLKVFIYLFILKAVICLPVFITFYPACPRFKQELSQYGNDYNRCVQSEAHWPFTALQVNLAHEGMILAHLFRSLM